MSGTYVMTYGCVVVCFVNGYKQNDLLLNRCAHDCTKIAEHALNSNSNSNKFQSCMLYIAIG